MSTINEILEGLGKQVFGINSVIPEGQPFTEAEHKLVNALGVLVSVVKEQQRQIQGLMLSTEFDWEAWQKLRKEVPEKAPGDGNT